jgi:hypothetical protein
MPPVDPPSLSLVCDLQFSGIKGLSFEELHGGGTAGGCRAVHCFQHVRIFASVGNNARFCQKNTLLLVGCHWQLLNRDIGPKLKRHTPSVAAASNTLLKACSRRGDWAVTLLFIPSFAPGLRTRGLVDTQTSLFLRCVETRGSEDVQG